MAVLFCDSMERMSVAADFLKKWSGYTTVPTYSATGGPSNGPYFQTSNTAQSTDIYRQIRPAGASAQATTRVACWFQIAGNPTTADSSNNRNFLKIVDDTAGTLASINISTTGRIVAYKSSTGGGAIAAGTGSATVTDGIWHHFELKYTEGTSGAIQIWIDGVSDISYSGNTRDNGTIGNALTKAETAHFWGAAGQAIKIADVLVWDDNAGGLTGQVGVYEIDSFLPDGAGDLAQFSVTGAGANYQAINESVADADTTYVSDATSGHIDLYTFTNMAVTPSAIYTVVVNNVVAAAATGTISYQAKAKSVATTVSSSSMAIAGLQYRSSQGEFSTDPNTSAAWTLSGLNAAQFGLGIV